MNIDEIKQTLLTELTERESASIDKMMSAYRTLLTTVSDLNMTDRETMITLCHTTIRCAKLIECPKDRLLHDLGAMFDMLTLLEEEAEGSIQ